MNSVFHDRRVSDSGANHSSHVTDGSLLTFTAALFECVTLEEVLIAVVERCGDFVGAQAVLVALITSDGDHLDIVRAAGYSPDSLREWDGFPVQEPSPLSDAVRNHATGYLASPFEFRRNYPALADRGESGFLSSASLPLAARRTTFGVVQFSFTETRLFGVAERELLEELARLCSIALGRACLFDAECSARLTAEKGLTLARKASEVLDTISDAVVTLDSDFRITFVNAEAARLNNKPAHAFVGNLHWEEWPAAVGTAFERNLRRCMKERIIARFEERYFVPGEYDVWIQAAAYPDENSGGLHIVYRDITREKERRADQIIDAGLVGILNFTLTGGVTDANDRFLAVVGYSRADLAGGRIDWSAMTPPEMHARDGEALRELGETGKHEPFEKQYIRKDGTRVPVIVGGSLFPGSQTEGVAFVLDLSDQKRAEQDREHLLTEQQRLVAQLRDASIRQRRFLREMLHGFTDGRLCLCDSAADLPRALPPCTDSLVLTSATLRQFRNEVAETASGLGLTEDRLLEFKTAAHEAAMNAVTHGEGGTARVHSDPEKGTIQVWVEDHGHGIADDWIHRAVEQGWTTGRFGQGFFLMRTYADRLFLLTGPQGTTIVLEQERVRPQPAWLSGVR